MPNSSNPHRKGRAGTAVKDRRQLARATPANQSRGAAAARRASAGIDTKDLEPTDWLFGDALRISGQRPG